MKAYTFDQLKGTKDGTVLKPFPPMNNARVIVLKYGSSIALLYCQIDNKRIVSIEPLVNWGSSFLFEEVNERFVPGHFEDKENEVVLNDQYTAVVGEDGVEVGCQRFTFDAVRKLAKVVEDYSKGG